MRMRSVALAVVALAVSGPANAGPILVTPTTNSATLSSALSGSGVTITSATVTNGAASQFGTYSNFSLIGDGLVLSSGNASQTTPAFHSTGSAPSTDTGAAGTSEFNAYGPGHIAHFAASYDVAALQVDFTLAADSQVAFDFVFGSVEYPVFTSSFTDAFLAFLDGTGTANQVSFDATNQAVQVGSTFASALTTTNTETAFYAPHGLLRLTTTTGLLGAGNHTLRFEVGDVNDHILDSAVFLSNLRTTVGTPGTGKPPDAVPEPGTMMLFGTGLVATVRKLRQRQA